MNSHESFYFILGVLSLSEYSFAGCGGPRCYTNIGINFPWNHWGTDTTFVNPADSFLLTVGTSGCYAVKGVAVYLNGSVIWRQSKSLHLKLPCLPGSYKINAIDAYPYYGTWNIVLLPKVKIETSSSVTDQMTSFLYTLRLNPDFIFYPNPTREQITLVSEVDGIKNITFYNSSGQILDQLWSTQ